MSDATAVRHAYGQPRRAAGAGRSADRPPVRSRPGPRPGGHRHLPARHLPLPAGRPRRRGRRGGHRGRWTRSGAGSLGAVRMARRTAVLVPAGRRAGSGRPASSRTACPAADRRAVAGSVICCPGREIVQVHRMDTAFVLRRLLRIPQDYFIHTQGNGLTGTHLGLVLAVRRGDPPAARTVGGPAARSGWWCSTSRTADIVRQWNARTIVLPHLVRPRPDRGRPAARPVPDRLGRPARGAQGPGAGRRGDGRVDPSRPRPSVGARSCSVPARCCPRSRPRWPAAGDRSPSGSGSAGRVEPEDVALGDGRGGHLLDDLASRLRGVRPGAGRVDGLRAARRGHPGVRHRGPGHRRPDRLRLRPPADRAGRWPGPGARTGPHHRPRRRRRPQRAQPDRAHPRRASRPQTKDER